MAAIKISDLEQITSVTDTDVLPIVNNDETKKITMKQIKEACGAGDLSNYTTRSEVSEMINGAIGNAIGGEY